MNTISAWFHLHPIWCWQHFAKDQQDDRHGKPTQSSTEESTQSPKSQISGCLIWIRHGINGQSQVGRHVRALPKSIECEEEEENHLFHLQPLEEYANPKLRSKRKDDGTATSNALWTDGCSGEEYGWQDTAKNGSSHCTNWCLSQQQGLVFVRCDAEHVSREIQEKALGRCRSIVETTFPHHQNIVCILSVHPKDAAQRNRIAGQQHVLAPSLGRVKWWKQSVKHKQLQEKVLNLSASDI